MCEYTPYEERQLLDNSIERVINTSIRLVGKYAQRDPDYMVNIEDWEELKALATKVWGDARNEVFKKRNKIA